MKKKLFFVIVFLIFLFIPFCVNAKEDDTITLYLFHGDGCPHCADELKFLNTIEYDYDNLEIVKYEVWYNDENAQLLSEVEKAFNIKKSGVPTTIIGNTVIIGFSDTNGSKIERAIKYYSENEYVDQIQKIKDGTFVYEDLNNSDDDDNSFEKIEEESDDALSVDVPVVGDVNLKKISLMSASVIIGLIDGFNPCAMWILIFLISVLIGMKDKKRMWALGLAFLITSAFVYMLIMLSWISIAVKITTVIWIRNLIAIIALIGAFLNLKSFINSRKNGGCEVVDDKKRKNIFKKIKKFTSEKSFILALIGVIGLAISVNLVELACSAGLPLVFSELLALNNVSSFMKFMYTLVYILFFLLDDLIVFFIAMFTMKITGISTKYNKFSHLFGGIIMLIIGILLIVKPEWLMFQFK